MKKATILIIVLGCLGVSFLIQNSNPDKWTNSTPLAEVLYALGKEKPLHHIPSIDSTKARLGREIVFTGRATLENGRKSSYVSKYFVCTDCHNQQREDPLLSVSDPQARLDYVVKEEIPFLQATTFWGIVNRESWYNQDYIKKYGDLVIPASKSLKESTKLCAIECSSGRPLKDWEIEALNHYYWTLELTMGDLELSDKEWRNINILAGSQKDRKEVMEMLDQKYMRFSPAHFTEIPEDLAKGYIGESIKPGDPAIGERIYESSCLTCHKQYGPSLLILDKSSFTMNKFKRHLSKDTHFNLYNILRKGTYAEAGHQQYMPHFPAERMSDQQVEDLRAYITSF